MSSTNDDAWQGINAGLLAGLLVNITVISCEADQRAEQLYQAVEHIEHRIHDLSLNRSTDEARPEWQR